MSLKDTAKAALGRLLADYRLNWIYAGGPWCAGRKAELDVAQIDAAMAELLAATPTVAAGMSMWPAVWPMGKKRDKRRLSASLALTG